MKVLLINPPRENLIESILPAVIEESRGFSPPLGLLYVAAHARKFTRHQIEFLDAEAEELTYPELKERIRGIDPEVVGITAMTFTLIDALKVARLVKEIKQDIRVVLGGPHPHIYPEETVSIPEVDFVILGEGERVFTELINTIDNIEGLQKIKGVVWKDNGRVINNGAAEPIADLNSLLFPARELSDVRCYGSVLARASRCTTMITSRGCPFRCRFCARPHLGKEFRCRSAENVLGEFEECLRMGIREFLIYDDTFTGDRNRVIDICEQILGRGLKFYWDIRAHVNSVDKEMLKKLKQAGCERIHYGVESGNPDILLSMRKGTTIERARQAFRLTREAGIETLAYFMIGSPGENIATVRQSIALARELKPGYVHFSILMPFPATELYRDGLENEIIKEDCWQEFARSPRKDFLPPVWEENLSRQELVRLLKKAYRDFYRSPAYILRRLLRVRSLGELWRQLRAGLRIQRLE
ncbi:MAG: cobalamin-dependent protein [Deltaproteobacteria bacterium]|nr:MAG: cobalamin-dependent protein [Deltaproteobacteria bacterium]